MNAQTKIESPCIDVCELDDADICRGCYRSLNEIGIWPNASEEEKEQVVKRSVLRKNIIARNIDTTDSL